MNNVSYKEITIGFLVIMMFVLSVSVGYLSHKTETVETKVSSIETNLYNAAD